MTQDVNLPDRAAVGRFDLADPPGDFIDDPFRWYRGLRTYAPTHRLNDGSRLLTRYADCMRVYRGDEFISDKSNLFHPKFGDSPLFEHHTTSLVFSDPPYHTRVRATLSAALKPRAISHTVAALETIVDGLLDELSEEAEFDLATRYAARIPVEVICSLLTVPESDRGHLRDWSLAILGALEPQISTEEQAEGDAAVTDFKNYLRELIKHRRTHPIDAPNNVLASLVAQHDAGELSEIELLHNLIFLLNAGHETTSNLIGNAAFTLLTHTTALDTLKHNAALIKGTIEEVLRFESPNQLGNREVAKPVQIGDVNFVPGDQISLCIGAANRDPAQFDDPETFDIRRTPNHHLAFGTGIHACVGMALARIEGKVAISKLFERLPNLTLGITKRRERLRFRGFESLMVAT
jgi:cytochrome P450